MAEEMVEITLNLKLVVRDVGGLDIQAVAQVAEPNPNTHSVWTGGDHDVFNQQVKVSVPKSRIQEVYNLIKTEDRSNEALRAKWQNERFLDVFKLEP